MSTKSSSSNALGRIVAFGIIALMVVIAIMAIYYTNQTPMVQEPRTAMLPSPKKERAHEEPNVAKEAAPQKSSDTERSVPISYTRYDDNYQCKVVSPIPDELKPFGLRPRYLEDGWICLIGDFDGNGYEDYVLFDVTGGKSVSGPVTVKYVMILADQDDIRRTQLIDDPNIGSLLLYPPRAEVGEFGEPVAEHAGLVHWGENSQSYIYLYDRVSDSLKRSDFELQIDSLSFEHAEGLGGIASRFERYKHMALIAAMVAKHRDDPRVANLYYAMGNLKKGAIYDFPYGNDIYYDEHKQDYWFYVPGDAWSYSGRHFQGLLARFPDSEYADDVAYETTLMFDGGHCEGGNFVGCHIAGESQGVVEFLHKYPNSPLAKAAVGRINKAYNKHLAKIDDLRVHTDDVTPEAVERDLRRYEDAAHKLEPYWRAKAYDTIGAVWEKFHNFDKAKEVYTYIVENVRHYGNRREIEKRLAALQNESGEQGHE